LKTIFFGIVRLEIFFLIIFSNIPFSQKWAINFNPLPPSDAVRKQKKVFYRIFLVQYYQNFKNIILWKPEI